MPLVDRKNINKAYHAAQDRFDDPDMILHELELRRMIDGHWNPYDRVTNASGVSRPPPDGSAWGHRYFYDQEAERLASDTWDKGWRFAPEFVRGSRHAAIDVHEKMRGIAAKRMDKRALIDNMHLMLPTPDRSADPSAPAHSYGAGLLAVDRATAENTRPYQRPTGWGAPSPRTCGRGRRQHPNGPARAGGMSTTGTPRRTGGTTITVLDRQSGGERELRPRARRRRHPYLANVRDGINKCFIDHRHHHSHRVYISLHQGQRALPSERTLVELGRRYRPGGTTTLAGAAKTGEEVSGGGKGCVPSCASATPAANICTS
eukprot:jgi/Mesvir1/9093/Mv03835-RA.1